MLFILAIGGLRASLQFIFIKITKHSTKFVYLPRMRDVKIWLWLILTLFYAAHFCIFSMYVWHTINLHVKEEEVA